MASPSMVNQMWSSNNNQHMDSQLLSSNKLMANPKHQHMDKFKYKQLATIRVTIVKPLSTTTILCQNNMRNHINAWVSCKLFGVQHGLHHMPSGLTGPDGHKASVTMTVLPLTTVVLTRWTTSLMNSQTVLKVPSTMTTSPTGMSHGSSEAFAARAFGFTVSWSSLDCWIWLEVPEKLLTSSL
jgi:hypothetical protein